MKSLGLTEDELDIWRHEVNEKGVRRLKDLLIVRNPDYANDKAPFVWKVTKGASVVGVYRSRWEADQCRNRIIENGGEL